MVTSPFDLLSMQRAMQEKSMGGVSKFARSMNKFDRRISISAIGGVLLLPSFQTSTYRLEMLAHAAASACDGTTAPRQKDLAAWMTEAGRIVGHHEDPAEDVFAAQVIFEGRNYRVLEGLSEGGCYHLQLILRVVEGMPDKFQVLKDGCRAALTLSEALCARAEIHPYEIGAEDPLRRRVSVGDIPPIRRLSGWVTFSADDLRDLGVRAAALASFVLPPSTRDVLADHAGGSMLACRPILEFDGDFVVALPTAIGPAIRTAVIEMCRACGPAATRALRTTHLTALTDQLTDTPMIHHIGLRPTALSLGPIVPSEPVEIEPGYWVQVVLAVDDLTGFEDGGLMGTAGNSAQVELALHQAITAAKGRCEAEPGFKAGLSYVIVCGFGGGQAIGLQDYGDAWFVEAVSSYDAEVLGWRSDFSLTDLFRLAMVERDLASKGFEVRHMNGLLAQVGDALANRGHLVPHEALPDGMPGGLVMAGINAQLRPRTEHHQRHDRRAVPTPGGGFLEVRREGDGARSPGGVSYIYLSIEDVRHGRLRAAWAKGDRAWWMEIRPRSEGAERPSFGAFEAQRTWMERIGPVLDEALPELPDILLWDLRIDRLPPTRADELVSARADEIRTAIEVRHDRGTGTITTIVTSDFWRGLSNPDNVAEASLVNAVVLGALRLAGRPDGEAAFLMERIVPSPLARQLHAFAPQDFRDHMREAFDPRVVHISPLQDGAIRIGLGWSGVPRPGGTVQGATECTQVLNAITSAAEDALCRDLTRFDRLSLIEAAVRNHEAAEIDDRRWKRTASAVIGLTHDEKAIRAEIAENTFKLNGVSLACRLLIEAGLHHCPSRGGLQVADIDLSRLMARAMMVFHLGGCSDAIRYGAMEPEVRVSPAGEVQIDVGFFKGVMEPVGQDFSDRQIDQEGAAYVGYLKEPDLPEEPREEALDKTFEAAWWAEFGVSFGTYRSVMDALEDLCMRQEKAWVVMPRADLLARLETKVEGATTVVSELESVPRGAWKQVPPGFEDLDRQPWRFRRRLSVARRPLIRLGEEENADVLVAPGIVREGLASTVGNMYDGNYEAARLTSRAMRRWAGEIANERGRQFQEKVAVRLRELGWTARTGVKFGEVFGQDPENDPGDIDVLAWHPLGRIALLECKKLAFAKTPSEVAKQLFKFRGAADEKGRPDLLAKHLNRWKIARKSVAALTAFTSTAAIKVEAGLVFSNTVPMQFAVDQMSEKLWVGTLEDLESL